MSEERDALAPPGYEYEVFYLGTHSPHDPQVVTRMIVLGAEGWRLTAANGPYLFFEREIADPLPTT